MRFSKNIYIQFETMYFGFDPNLSSWVRESLIVFCLCLEPPEPPKNLPKKPPEPPKNIPKPEPSKHPFFFSTTFTKKIREHFLFGTIKKSGNISKTQWCLDHLHRNSLLLTFLVDHMKIWSKHPFKGQLTQKITCQVKTPLKNLLYPKGFTTMGPYIQNPHGLQIT